MTDKIEKIETTEQIETATPQKSIYTIPYILEQIAKIQEQTTYLNDALTNLANMPDGDSGECGSPGNIQGQAKATAYADIVRCRETTNQQMLKLYEKMYDDLKKEITPKSNTVSNLQEITAWLKTQNRDEYDGQSWLAMIEAVKAQMSRNY